MSQISFPKYHLFISCSAINAIKNNHCVYFPICYNHQHFESKPSFTVMFPLSCNCVAMVKAFAKCGDNAMKAPLGSVGASLSKSCLAL